MPDAFPTKESGYIGKEVKCNDGVTASWNNITWTLSDIKVKDKKRIICTVNFSEDTSEATLAEKAKRGDYIEMTPTLDNFTVPSSLTGYNSDQTINPSELTKWRIINIKKDGTIELISDYISTGVIYFKGLTGYKNYVGILNLIANSYTNSNYTIGSRALGYNGQTSFLKNENENIDTEISLHDSDFYIIHLMYNTYGGKINKTETNGEYWIAGRGTFQFNNQTNYGVRLVRSYKDDYTSQLIGIQADNVVKEQQAHIRPIVILKSGITTSSGSGTSDNPWKLN